MKIIFNLDDNLPLTKILKLHMLKVIARSVFQEDGKYYPQFFQTNVYMSYKCYEFDTIDISEGIDIAKTNASKECDI